MRPSWLFLVLLGWLIACQPIVAATSNEPISLWLIEDKDTQVYLLGSIHVMRDDMYPLPQAMERAFEEADVTAFEVDMRAATSAKAIAYSRDKGFYKGQDSVYNRLDEDTLQLLSAYFKDQGLNLREFARLKPWMLTVQIGLLELNNLGFDPNRGIDLHFQRKAIEAGKPIIALETFEEQIDVLSADEPAVQALGLKLSLRHIDDAPLVVERLMEAWRRGDASAMYEVSALEYERHPALNAQFERLLDERNHGMASKIRQFLNDGPKTYFVAVGALHMGGEEGLLELLNDDFKVQQLKR